MLVSKHDEEVEEADRDYQDHFTVEANRYTIYLINEEYNIYYNYCYLYPNFYAKPNDGFTFVGWKFLDAKYWKDYAIDPTVDIRDYMGEEILTTEAIWNCYELDMTTGYFSDSEDEPNMPEDMNISLVACFGHVKLDYIPGQSELGTMTNSDPAADFGDFTEISAQPAEGVTFEYWLDDEGNKYYDNPLEVTLERNITYRPMFSHPDYITLDFGEGKYKLLGSENKAYDYDHGSVFHYYLSPGDYSYMGGATGEKETVSYVAYEERDTVIYKDGMPWDTVVNVPVLRERELTEYYIYSYVSQEECFPGGPYAINARPLAWGTRNGDAALFYGKGLVTLHHVKDENDKFGVNYLVSAPDEGTDIENLSSGYRYYIFDEEGQKFVAVTTGYVPAGSAYLALPKNHHAAKYDEILVVDKEAYDPSNAFAGDGNLLADPDFMKMGMGWDMKGLGGNWKIEYTKDPRTVETYAGNGPELIRYHETQDVYLEPGTYQLSTNAFYRYGVWYDTNPEISEAKLFAGTDSIDIVTLGSIRLESYANSMSEASKAFAAGLYNNVLTFTVVKADSITVGICGTHSYPRSWFINGPFSLKKISDAIDTEHVTNLYVNFSREEGKGYVPADIVEFDAQAVREALGIETWDQTMTAPVNVTDGSVAKDWIAKNYDGWLNPDGDVTNWGNNNYVCLKTPTADGTMALCTEPGNEPAAGTEYLAKWAVFTATDTVIINTTITFTAPVPAEVTNIAQCEVVKNIVVKVEEKANTSYSGQTSTFDVAAVCEALEIETIGEADQYILNITDGALLPNTTDGWRNGDGDAETWANMTSNSIVGGVCVKINKPSSGEIDYIGCFDASHNAGEKYTAKWAFVKGNKAAIVSVVIRFVGDTPFAIGGEGVMTYGAEQIATGHTYKWSATGSAITIDVDIDTDEAISRGAFEMGCFTLPIEELNDFLDTDVRELDESTFYALQPDGSEVAEMTSYKPGMWIDANGYADNWQTGVCYWQWYIWGGKADKNGYTIGYDYDYNQFPGRVMIGTNPGNVAKVKGSSVTSNNVIVANGAKYSFTVNVTFGDGNGISDIKSDADNQAIYDLTGRKIETPTRHGIYIQGGKKVLK